MTFDGKCVGYVRGYKEYLCLLHFLKLQSVIPRSDNRCRNVHAFSRRLISLLHDDHSTTPPQLLDDILALSGSVGEGVASYLTISMLEYEFAKTHKPSSKIFIPYGYMDDLLVVHSFEEKLWKKP